MICPLICVFKALYHFVIFCLCVYVCYRAGLLSLSFFPVKLLVVQNGTVCCLCNFFFDIACKCNLRVQYLGMNETTLYFLGAARFDLFVTRHLCYSPLTQYKHFQSSTLCINTNIKWIVIFLMIVA